MARTARRLVERLDGWIDGCARGVQCATICLGCMVIKDGCSKVRVYKEVGDEAFPVRCTDWFDPIPRTYSRSREYSRYGGIHGYRESYWDSRKSVSAWVQVGPVLCGTPRQATAVRRAARRLPDRSPHQAQPKGPAPGAVLMLCAPSIGSLRTANGHAAAPRRRADPCVHVCAVCPHRSSVARAAHRGCAVR